jgi:hypothetical protein
VSAQLRRERKGEGDQTAMVRKTHVDRAALAVDGYCGRHAAPLPGNDAQMVWFAAEADGEPFE